VSRRLAWTFAAFAAALLVLLAVPLGIATVRLARTQLLDLAGRQAGVFASLVADLLGPRDRAALVLQTARVPLGDGDRALVFDADGQLLADSGASAPLPPLSVARAALAGNAASQVVGEPVDGAIAASPIVSPTGEVLGAAAVLISDDRVEAGTRRQLLALAGGAVGILALAAAAGVQVARSFTRPVAQLDRAAQRLAAGDLDARAPVPAGPPELRRLAVSFNTSSARLAELLQAQRSFTSDASHQLRTPLTALRLRLEGLEAAHPGDPGVAAALAEVRRLSRLVEELLALSRVEGARPHPVATDLGACVRERAELWEPLAADQGVTLRAEVRPGTPRAWAVPGAPEQVLDNLLANALTVAPEASSVDLTAGPAGGDVVVTVADRGPGLDGAQRTQAFERFWRGPAAKGEGGSGLGLPIARQLVAASGGRLSLEARDGGGLVAVARFPVAEPA
jgi:signal transduction histidine kinase